MAVACAAVQIIADQISGSCDVLGSRMTRHIASWVEEFLRDRKLEHPDGRALYAYRCTAVEFSSLAEALSHTVSYDGASPAIRAFVLYAAEWWQRRYDGRHWAWEPLLASIGWRHVHYPDLYDPIRDALRWWRVDLVRLPTSVRYLGTFACQGGLPLALVGDAQSRVTQYLRAVLKHTAAYRQFVNDPIELARDQQHLLRPPTLRRDYVFRLAADLVDAVLDLEGDAQDEDPLSALDQTHPNWRETMPLDLGNERARELLAGLLREATRDRVSPINDFRVERFLRRTGVGWRLGARARLPASLSADHLARRIGISAPDDLPPRLQVRIQGDRVRVIGLYARSSENYLLVSRDAQSATEIWDAEATGEVRLQFLAGNVVGELVVPSRGGALGDLPWAFRGDDDECPFIGEGSASNRAPEIVVLVPDGCTVEDRAGGPLARSSAGNDEGPASRIGEEVRILDRTLWRIDEPTALETGNGRCIIRPSEQATEEEHRLSGQRFYNLEAAWPLFRGTPKLHIAKSEQAPRAVPAGEVTWRTMGGEWRQNPDVFGLWEVRHVRGGELRHLGRCGILPDRFDLSVEPGSDMNEGHLAFNGAEAVMVSGHGEEAVVEVREKGGDVVRVHVAARDATPPVNVHLRLHWSGASPLPVQAPFPGQGGRFLHAGRPLKSGRAIAVDDLYGVRATALSPDNSRKFWIAGELEAPDPGSLLRVAHFRRSLRKSGVVHELPLIDVRPMIELLLATSSSSDARVVLRIVDRYGQELGAAQVSRFAAALEFDPGMAFVSVSPTLDDEPAVTFEALPLSRPNEDPITLDTIGPADDPRGAAVSDIDTSEPWLVVARHDNRVRVQPIVIGGRSGESGAVGARDTEPPCLAEAMRDEDFELRTTNIAAAMNAMLEEMDTQREDEDWSFLTDALLRAEGLPATELDLLKILVTTPSLLVRCMFRLESTHRQLLWRLEDELPFSWLLIRRDIWWTETKQAFDRLRGQLSGAIDGDHDQSARDHICSILSEGEDRLPALGTTVTDVELRLAGGRVSEEFVANVCQMRDEETPEQIRLRASQDDWPKGDGRNEWQQELERGELLAQAGLWQSRNEPRARQPVFDTPVAAAWCCFLSKPTPRTTFLVKRTRMHDPEWFDLAYKAAWFWLALKQDKSSSR